MLSTSEKSTFLTTKNSSAEIVKIEIYYINIFLIATLLISIIINFGSEKREDRKISIFSVAQIQF